MAKRNKRDDTAVYYATAFSGADAVSCTVQTNPDIFPGWKQVFCCELDPDKLERGATGVRKRDLPNASAAMSVLRKNTIRPDCPNLANILTGDPPPGSPVPNLLILGSPCVSFSGCATDAKGRYCGEGYLFLDAARFGVRMEAEFLVFENSDRLASKANLEYLKEVQKTLAMKGYASRWMTLNPRDYGQPIRRPRLWMLADRHGTMEGLEEIISSVKGAAEKGNPLPATPDYWRNYLDDDGPHMLDLVINMSNCRMRLDRISERMTLDEYAMFERALSRETPNGRVRTCLPPKFWSTERKTQTSDLAYTITKGGWGNGGPVVEIGGKAYPRKFSAREAERMQGFPGDWTDGVGLSERQRFALMGNSMNCHILKLLLSEIQRVKRAKWMEEREIEREMAELDD